MSNSNYHIVKGIVCLEKNNNLYLIMFMWKVDTVYR